MYKVIIADDEQHAINLMVELLKSFPTYTVVDKVTNSIKLLPSILKNKPDLVLLDINFGKDNGIDLAKEINQLELNTEIIFATAYAEHALDAFDCKACDYLMKPISISRFSKALKHFEEHKHTDINIEKLVNNTLRFNTQQGFIIVKPNDIICLVADQVYTTIHTLDNKRYHVSINIGKIESMLDVKKFIRSSRSSIVNINYLREVSRKKRTCIVGLNGYTQEVKLSKTGTERLEEYFQQ
ncbi:LytR/AlgR family response regulator transcription factor [Carboxylicivirga caseinilyticus]|uniref:LytR/AlgR family response regulator transcription factor n=1 Tax=Carboxylicivirga caseinilyticus TaxID=3417572 RepID=UPI003D32E898|nr:response regulator transcription factor [Marinilabiliaceae bacterium A049]